ncbi:putative Protein Simiate [Hypsibius exemplaris]|uniref:Protein Abitram n=1 Tax=Hypsibius exemplaris TaxID=2072580 RepID=A0A1W0WR48_HYPEX|nr:putative Protein Simiate [Hypsibius exemplaris]
MAVKREGVSGSEGEVAVVQLQTQPILPSSDGHFAPSSSIPWSLPKYIDVNYSRLFQIDQRKDSSEDCCLFIHTNRLCVLALAPSHPIYRLHQTPVSVTFQISDGTDRSLSHAQGARKKGAQFLTEGACVCHVDCSDGTRYDIVSGIKGKLLEVNTRLMEAPQLLSEKPFSDGYLAIIMPNELEMSIIRNTLHDEAAYQELRFAQIATEQPLVKTETS